MKKKKRAITLIEVMIVILLIGLIGGALALNTQGGLTKGKEFLTKQNQQRIHDILNLELADTDKTVEEIVQEWTEIVKKSPLANGEKTLVDGHKKQFTVTYENDDFVVNVTP